MDQPSPAVIEREVVERYRRLRDQRGELIQQRAAILAMLRANERELDDCRATARFFQLNLMLPELDAHADVQRAEYHQRNARSLSPSQFQFDTANPPLTLDGRYELPVSTVRSESAAGARIRPALREYLVAELRAAGAAGARAAGLSAAYQHTYRVEIHEKTVGMTLYRLAGMREVHRRGHVWFIGPDPEGDEAVSTETKP